MVVGGLGGRLGGRRGRLRGGVVPPAHLTLPLDPFGLGLFRVFALFDLTVRKGFSQPA